MSGGHKKPSQDAEALSLFTELTTYLGYLVLIVFGHLRDKVGLLTKRSRYLETLSPKSKGFAPLVAGWENFYTRRLFNRIQDCWNRPISSAPGARIDVMERETADQVTMQLVDGGRKVRNCVNLGSYNYLGFADDWESTCGPEVRETVATYGVGCCSARADVGTTVLHEELERVVAKFVGKPAAVVFNMGYGTNSSSVPALMGPGALIVSDALNHTSIVNGCRASGATIRPFAHNDAEDLEAVLQRALAEGQRSKRKGAGSSGYKPWTKILVMVEGIYSMEGEICKLREIVDIAKRYKAYMYVDEAHSIGALGKTGRGVCEHTGVDPSEIDILMGTFTKSFGGMGGYIASSEEMIAYLKSSSSGCVYNSAISPLVCRQILSAFRIIDGTELGKRKLDDVKSNSNYFRNELRRMGCSVLGDDDSPVIPVMLYHPTKIAAFSRECYKRDLAAVVVGFPAVPIYGARARFCISAAHKKEDLKVALKKIREVCKILNLRYAKSSFG